MHGCLLRLVPIDIRRVIAFGIASRGNVVLDQAKEIALLAI
jgi:hypothetical protein